MLKILRSIVWVFTVFSFFNSSLSIIENRIEPNLCYLSQCSTPLSESSLVYLLCSGNQSLELDGRCCKNIIQPTIIGLDLSNCGLNTLNGLLNNITDIKTLILNANPITECLEGNSLIGMTHLEYLVLPGQCKVCPDTESEYKVWQTTEYNQIENYTLCANPYSICNQTDCPSNSYCVEDGPGHALCLCDLNYHGYKCLNEGEFLTGMYLGVFGASTLFLSALLWITQRRHVKK